MTAFSVYCTLECEINAHLYNANLIVNSNSLCGYINENVERYLLHCNRFTLSPIIMLFEINKLNLIGVPVNIDLLLFGNETLSCDIKYIRNTCRVSMS